MKTITKKLLVVGLMILSVGVFAADVPNYINYQGLLGEDGRAVNGTRDITFRLYDAFDAATSFWDRTRSVEIIDGVFNELLGPFNTAQLDKFATSVEGVYLEIEVDSEVFPRQQLLSVGYAFRSQSAATIDNNAVTSAKIAYETIVSTNIQNRTIKIEDLADEVLDGGGVANDSITTSKLADGAVISRKIAFETIVSTNIRDGSITAVKIIDDAVTTNKIVNDAVTTNKIIDNAVNTSKIADSAVTTAKIADGAVTTAKIAVDAIPSSVPSGTIVMWAGTSLPDEGWAFCDGSAVSRTTYAKLFEVIGVRFGSGNGSTTFNLPDLTNKFIVAWGSDYGIGSTGGTVEHGHDLDIADDGGHTPTTQTHDSEGNYYVEDHKLTIDEIPEHNHNYDDNTYHNNLARRNYNTFHNDSLDTGGPWEINQLECDPIKAVGGGLPHKHQIKFVSIADHDHNGSTADSENHLPPYYALAFIMKL